MESKHCILGMSGDNMDWSYGFDLIYLKLTYVAHVQVQIIWFFEFLYYTLWSHMYCDSKDQNILWWSSCPYLLQYIGITVTIVLGDREYSLLPSIITVIPV